MSASASLALAFGLSFEDLHDPAALARLAAQHDFAAVDGQIDVVENQRATVALADFRRVELALE